MIIRRLLRHAAPYKAELALSVGLGLLAVASNVGLLATAAYLVAAAALKPLLVALTIPLYIVRAGGVARAVTRYTERLATHSVTFRIIARLRAWLFARLLPLAPARLLPFRSGDLLARLLKDLEEMEHLYVRGVAPLAVAALGTVATTAILFAFNPLLALVATPNFLVAGALLPWLMQRLVARQGERELEARGKLHAQVIDGVQGLADLLACGAVDEYNGHLAATGERLRLFSRRRALIGGLHQAAMVLLAGMAAWAVLLVGIPLVRGGHIPGVWLACIALLVLSSFEALAPVGTALAHLGRAEAAGRRMFELVDLPPAVADPPDPSPLPETFSLTFDEVTFSYGGPDTASPEGTPVGKPAVKTAGRGTGTKVPSPRDARSLVLALAGVSLPGDFSRRQHAPHLPEPALALDGVSFALGPSGRLAIVGGSGSGKSTVARLALRLYDPTGGAIRLGERDLSAYRLEDLRGAIALVPQSSYLFADTLRRNLLLGRPDAGEDELQDAIAAAQLDAVIAQLPWGLETPLGENGVTLSGGERQRVAIARALLMRPRLLILDEATANLDPVTERAILRAVMARMAGRALLVISHRLVEMEMMDEILVLERGRVVERGAYEALACSGGPFGDLLAAQNEMLEAPAHQNPQAGAPVAAGDAVLV